jgi:hypothetical protein
VLSGKARERAERALQALTAPKPLEVAAVQSRIDSALSG